MKNLVAQASSLCVDRRGRRSHIYSRNFRSVMYGPVAHEHLSQNIPDTPEFQRQIVREGS
jgi:hypothetical protein